MHLTVKRTGLNLVTVLLPIFIAFSALALPAPDTTKAPAPAKPKPAAGAIKSAGTRSTASKSPGLKGTSATKKSAKPASPGNVNTPPPGKIHTLEEIVEIIKASNLYYAVDTLDIIQRNAFLGDTSRPVLSGNQHIKVVDNVPKLVNYKLSNIGIPLMGMAAGSFQDKDYAGAVAGYQRLMGTDPSFDLGYSYIGEAYLMQDSLDSAGVYLTRTIDKNYIDFTTHRLLGEVFWKSGDRVNAIKELTIAHVLNVNDPKIRGQLDEWRLLAGRTWNGEPITPRYGVYKKGDTVYVKATLDWIGYAMVKAVWQYEPGYATKQLGYDPKGSVFVMMQEKEALVGAMSTNRKMGYMNPIVQQGYLEEFILYELVGPRHPMNIVVLPKPEIERIVEYVDKFR